MPSVAAGAVNLAIPAQPGTVSDASGNEDQAGRRRGRRGGRGRGERRNEGETAVPASTAVDTGDAAPATEPVRPAANEEALTGAISSVNEPAATEKVVGGAIATVAVSPPETQECTFVTPAAAAPAPPADAPVDLEQTLAASGLVLVQTTGTTVAPAEPPLRLGRPRKAKAVEAGEEAPLVMVETQK